MLITSQNMLITASFLIRNFVTTKTEFIKTKYFTDWPKECIYFAIFMTHFCFKNLLQNINNIALLELFLLLFFFLTLLLQNSTFFWRYFLKNSRKLIIFIIHKRNGTATFLSGHNALNFKTFHFVIRTTSAISFMEQNISLTTNSCEKIKESKLTIK